MFLTRARVRLPYVRSHVCTYADWPLYSVSCCAHTASRGCRGTHDSRSTLTSHRETCVACAVPFAVSTSACSSSLPCRTDIVKPLTEKVGTGDRQKPQRGFLLWLQRLEFATPACVTNVHARIWRIEKGRFPISAGSKKLPVVAISGYAKHWTIFQSRTFSVIRELCEQSDRSDAIGWCKYILETGGQMYVLTNEINSISMKIIFDRNTTNVKLNNWN